jgi:hypothetical protein
VLPVWSRPLARRARSSAVEHLTFNQRVLGSIPNGLTTLPSTLESLFDEGYAEGYSRSDSSLPEKTAPSPPRATARALEQPHGCIRCAAAHPTRPPGPAEPLVAPILTANECDQRINDALNVVHRRTSLGGDSGAQRSAEHVEGRRFHLRPRRKCASAIHRVALREVREAPTLGAGAIHDYDVATFKSFSASLL